MLCQKCKTDLADDFVFCPHCGKDQTKPLRTGAAKHRGNGQGSVYKRGKTWAAARVFGYNVDENGKMSPIKTVKCGFRTKTEALAYLPQLTPKKRTSSKNIVTTKTTVKDMYELWYPTHEARGRGKSTLGCYSAAIKHLEDIWNLPFSEAGIDDWQECIDECGCGKRTKENIRALISLMYKYAIPRGGTTDQLNLSQYLFVAGENGRRQPFTAEEVELIRRSIGTVPYADYIYCNIYLGYRPTEFLTRTIEEHLNADELCIYGGIKTKAGQRRTVTISPKIAPHLLNIVGGRQAGRIFCRADNGEPLTNRKYRQVFAEALAMMGIQSTEERKLTPYCCRHTFASMADKVVGNDNAKLELMGHTDVDTLRHYQHADLEALRKITDNI